MSHKPDPKLAKADDHKLQEVKGDSFGENNVDFGGFCLPIGSSGTYSQRIDPGETTFGRAVSVGYSRLLSQ
jgi:hypothetical protein